MDIPTTLVKPYYQPPVTNEKSVPESPNIQKTIRALQLQPHPEGGYYSETDRHPLRVPNPYRDDMDKSKRITEPDAEKATRSASTTIYYFITPRSPMGYFHRNRSRTVHTLHRGRGRYVILHADQAKEDGGKVPIESFVVGHRIDKGERLQWVVEGGKYKSSYLLPDCDGDLSGDNNLKSEGLLISETVVPGFGFYDHDFLTVEKMEQLLTAEQAEELKWMARKSCDNA
ncbi:RmlC-like cupin domain-containing protein [Aspergillus pseudonomiae]|uniref:RmlC-like cupin domain-containing protein n=1 Tax=Aspergillus pseudonomiae TaxID=1506151 RepID=A0A5N7DNI9_9EURO|nr:RmlC-like cupin domain-containing protein [Aspergillus pseudonomiae]KAE8407976.1 RmlC-like cupin domain-containing protein [Aspergillus pseudonomiae]